jgi:fatty acid desaturase
MTAEITRARPLRPASDYSTLMAEVRRTGLLDRSAWSYLPRAVVLTIMVIVGVSTFVWLGQSWWQLAVAAYSAVVFTQLGFIGHDLGHQQVFRSKRWNDRVGLVLSNLVVGLSYGWWVDKHTRHHTHPNEVGRDPDVQRNVLSWTQAQSDSQRGPLRVIARHQALLFFPLTLLEALNLHAGSVRVLMAPRRAPARVLEITLLAVHFLGCLALLLLVLSPVKAVAFLAVQQSLFGLYLGASFAPNHKGMPIVESGCSADFLRRQVLTSRNVTGGRVVAVAFGGLNYQIEHHLFPCMPSRNLRRCRPLVKSFCAAHDVAYCETSLFGSYSLALAHLRSVQLRGVRPADRP